MGALYLLYLLYIFILQYLNIFVDGKLVGAFVFPHGGIAIDPYYFPANQTKRHEVIKNKLHLYKKIFYISTKKKGN